MTTPGIPAANQKAGSQTAITTASEYVRRRLAQDAAVPGTPVSVQDLARFADVFADLGDPDVMTQAWH